MLKIGLMLVVSLVALRKESVDRNYQANAVDQILPGVALRKESVDRNTSPHSINSMILTVALRKESVDRNMWWGVRKAVGSRRSPQGERG